MKVKNFNPTKLEILPAAKNKRYIIMPLKKQMKTATGIILPTNQHEHIGYGIVMCVPNDGSLETKKGKLIMYNNQMAYPTFNFKGKDVIIVYEVDVFAVFEEDIEDLPKDFEELEQEELNKKIG